MSKVMISFVAVVAIAVGITGVAGSGPRPYPPARAGMLTSADHVRSITHARGGAPLVSEKLAALGSSVTSPRGPYRARPRKIAFDLGGYYGAGTKGLWIDHLKWVDWGQPVAYASGVVHARVWPSTNFMTTAGGIMLDQVRSCGAHSYYTYASMLVPAGYPANTESTSGGISEQALTPC